MLFVICYDISDDRRRRRVEKTLRDFGHRVQFSVFEGEMDEGRYQKMKVRVEKVIDPESDSVRYYRLCGRCRFGVEISGLGEIPHEEDEILVI